MNMDGTINNSNELEFAVFCVENVAAKLGIGAEKVYKAFTDKSNILKDYIIPEYEILHTQSKEYIVDDIIELMQERRCDRMILSFSSKKTPTSKVGDELCLLPT